ncbi:sensor histidine kinase [Actinomadura darangshiensis]|uniref:histidine kinase n=1 Tax=Actinomadura darangshiensis TaxID=705336 RepID=A0A4R4ZQV8_9ACTN|nr:sensor histidine kinase [Actinomadura darangshiensis]TDD61333.1 sensor histidine kinase [Actinomadura darangshiensis]
MGDRRSPRPPHGRLRDAALAGAVLLVVSVSSVNSLIGDARGEPWPTTAFSWALILLACGALYFARRYPAAVGALVLVTTGVYYITSRYDGGLMIALIVALYLVAAGGRLQAALVLAALTVIGTGIGTLLGNEDVNGVALFMLTGWVVAVVALGWVWHSRLAYLREAERRAAGEERLRIARELHDVVGHHLSLINVQAGTALHRFHRDPGQGESALAAVKESSRQALRDLRATLGVLRQADEEAPIAPAPGLDRIGELIGSARSAGLTVHSRVAGAADPPTEVGLAAYRIVQESLTNVSRHAAAAEVTVSVERGPEELVIEVADDGPGESTGHGTPGSGVDGMRERARALGGELTAGPGPDGGFRVRARLPYGVPSHEARGASAR